MKNGKPYNITRAGARGSQGRDTLPASHKATSVFESYAATSRASRGLQGGGVTGWLKTDSFCKVFAFVLDGNHLASSNGSLKIRPPEFTLAAWVRDVRLTRCHPRNHVAPFTQNIRRVMEGEFLMSRALRSFAK